MPLHNADGRAVDPVPFLVVSLSASLVILSYGPIYFRTWGLSLDTAVAVSGLLSLAGVCCCYYRYIWTYRPDAVAEVPVASRVARLGYGMVIFTLVLFALALPLWL